jgi:hypothetical protein
LDLSVAKKLLTASTSSTMVTMLLENTSRHAMIERMRMRLRPMKTSDEQKVRSNAGEGENPVTYMREEEALRVYMIVARS